MATIPAERPADSYDSRKLREVLRHCEAPFTDDVVDPSFRPVPETARTRRMRNELDKTNVSAIVLYLAALVPIVLVAMLFS